MENNRMKEKIINLILCAGWHEGEISVTDDIMALYNSEIDDLKRKLREAEEMLKNATKNATASKEPVEKKEPIPTPAEFLSFFSLTTQREIFYNNMLTRNWAIEAMEDYVQNFYITPKKP